MTIINESSLSDVMPAQKAFWKDKRCLVTGGYGFAGSHLCQQLIEAGAKVWVLDRESPGNSYLELAGLSRKTDFILGDIRDLGLVKITLDRFNIDTIFHLAAQPIVPVNNSCPYESLSVNVMGTYSILEAARTSAAKPGVVFASSGAFYGTTFETGLIREDFPPQPAANIYAPSKIAADIAVRSYAKTFGMRTAVCRFINIYGPGCRNLGTIVPTAISKLIRDESFDFGDRDDGSSTFDYLYIKDVARAYMTVGENIDHISGEAFNFGGGNPISVKDLTKLISRLYDGQEREPIFRGRKKEIPIRKCLDTNKAQRLLKWGPSISLEGGLKETINWYRDNWAKL
jgi:nucleoside-diphosphate-sugar epimerase